MRKLRPYTGHLYEMERMKAYCYLRISGLDLSSIDGARYRWYEKNQYWLSSRVVLSAMNEDGALKLIASAVSDLNRDNRGETSIDFVIAREQASISCSASFYFSAQLIEMLGKLGAGIDYDVVTHLKLPDEK